jgi:outer membrane immunogenic protein
MRSIVLAGGIVIAALAVGPAAQAADSLSDPGLSAYDWTGAYAGIHGGGGRSRVSWTYVPSGSDASHNGSGAFGGVQLGYNWQTGGFVFGGEADIAYGNINGSTPCPNPAFSCRSDVNWLGSVRGRVGYAFSNVLIYGTGGLGLGGVRIETVLPGGSVPPSGGPANGERRTLAGWTAGAGAEVAFSSNWSVKAEYLYYGFGRRSFSVDNNLETSIRPDFHTFKIGVNYRW